MIPQKVSSPANKTMLKVCLGLLAFLFYVLVAEMAMQLSDLYLNRKYGQPNAETFLHEYDPIRGWKNKADSTAYFVVKTDRIRSHGSINAKGLRGPDYDYAKPKGVKRVLLLGDSMIAGFEVSEDQTVAQQLEKLLAKETSWQVINGGVRGYGTDQAYLFLMYEGFRYQPDIIIYVFADNDLENNVTVHVRGKTYSKSYFTVGANGELHLAGIPTPAKNDPNDRTRMAHPVVQKYFDELDSANENGSGKLKPVLWLRNVKKFLFEHSKVYRFATKQLKQIAPVRELLFRLGISHVRASSPRPAEVLEAEWYLMEHLLVNMEKFSQSIYAHFAVFEVVNGIEESRPAPELENISKKHNIPLIHSYEVFTREALMKKRGPLRWKDKIHWTTQGHALAASAIYNFLKSRGWLKAAKVET